MRIVLVGGGSGGHFYPLIAVAEAIEEITKERTLIEPELIYIGPEPFDKSALLEHAIIYESGTAGKMRTYRSALNIFDSLKTAVGITRSIFQLYRLYPDVVFSTGGYAAFPSLVAAKILKIPVIIYDADAKPGRVSLWSSKFATWIGIAHMEAAPFYPKNVLDRVARVGHPIRKEIETPAKEGGYEFLNLDQSVPCLMIMGGSQGAQTINEAVLDALPDLIQRYNIVHQTGQANIEEVSKISQVVLKDSPHQNRYRSFGLLNTLAIRMTAGISSIIVARAGSGTIFEIASWGIPAIVIPIPEDVSHDQTENAFSYARAGGAVVIEQRNLTPHLLVAEIDRLMNDEARRAKMSEAARAFARPAAARKIATAIVETALEHTET